ncbi:MAG: hypothetical protein KY476_01710 [Planctomycetes bacterium]|nr:hypothetical protein [Planctomycetota bacterium]
MRFALLGDDPAALPLVRALADDERHRLVCAAHCGTLQAELMTAAPAVRIASSWEELLQVEKLDAVIVAGAEDEMLTGARQLAAAGRPLLVVPHPQQGTGFAYELTLVRDDAHVALVPAFVEPLHPLVAALRDELHREGTRPLHVAIERELASPEREGPPLLREADVLRRLLFDTALARSLFGEYSQVTALLSGRTENGLLSAATVSLAGEHAPETSWTLKSTTGAPRWVLRVTSESGVRTLTGGDDAVAWTLDPTHSEAHGLQPVGLARLHSRLLEGFADAVAGAAISPDWTDYTRSLEIVEAAGRSVARRRTVDLHFEQTSERSQFKTQMTALGCGLLCVTLFAVVALLMVGAMFKSGQDEHRLLELVDAGRTLPEIANDPELMPGYSEAELAAMLQRMELGETVMSVARIAVFVPLAIFLAMQLLVFIARPAAGERASK